MKGQITENIVVYDIRGQICPSCLLFTLREVNDQRSALKDGKIQILIKTDNRNATSTIPDAIASMGYAYTVIKKDSYYEIIIMAQEKKESSA